MAATIPIIRYKFPPKLKKFKAAAHCRSITSDERKKLFSLPEKARKKLSRHFGLNGLISATFRFDAIQLEYRTNLTTAELADLVKNL